MRTAKSNNPLHATTSCTRVAVLSGRLASRIGSHVASRLKENDSRLNHWPSFVQRIRHPKGNNGGFMRCQFGISWGTTYFIREAQWWQLKTVISTCVSLQGTSLFNLFSASDVIILVTLPFTLHPTVSFPLEVLSTASALPTRPRGEKIYFFFRHGWFRNAYPTVITSLWEVWGIGRSHKTVIFVVPKWKNRKRKRELI